MKINKIIYLAAICFSLLLATNEGWGATYTATFNTAGTHSFTVPENVTSITVQVWGAGGRGSFHSNSSAGKAGGGGGAFSSSTLTGLTPGTVYSLYVGTGATTTAAGEDSWFSSNTTVMAKGGSSVADNTNVAGVGGLASAGVGTTKFNGGTGATGTKNSFGGGGGSSAGTGANGNFTSSPNQQAGATAPGGGGAGGAGGNGSAAVNGSAPGGGGGGGEKTFSNPGNGADGQVVIIWTTCNLDITNFSTSATSPVSQGSSSTVTVTSNTLATGSYTVYYDLSGANSVTGASATMNFTAGTPGTGTFSTSTLANTGSTTITLKSFGCAWTSTNNTALVTVTAGAPTVTSFTNSPACYGSGVSVVITGTNFTGTTAVTFNGVSATYTVDNSTQITATLPATATTGPIAVTNASGTGTSASNFVVNALPTGTLSNNGPILCDGDNAILTFNATAGTGPFDLIINGSSHNNIADGGTISVTPSYPSTVYTLTSITDKGVSPNCANTVNVSTTVTVSNEDVPLPAFDLTPSNTIYSCQSISFDAGASTHTCPARSISTYQWDFSYSGVFNTEAVGSTTSHTFTIPGNFTVALRVTDDQGKTAIATDLVTVNPPAATIVSGAGTFCESTTINASGGEGGTIYFQGTTSGGTNTTTPSTSELITSSGTYYFRSMSSCGFWGTEGSAVVTINPIPTISGTLTVNVGATTTLTGSGTPHGTTPWTSGTESVATVNSSGVVTGVSVGTSLITYMDINGCTKSETVTVSSAAPTFLIINSQLPLR